MVASSSSSRHPLTPVTNNFVPWGVFPAYNAKVLQIRYLLAIES